MDPDPSGETAADTDYCTLAGPTTKTAPSRHTFRRQQYIQNVKDAFTPLAKSHGSVTETVILWGAAGTGKKQIAAQAAADITASDGRKVLFVNGTVLETFIPSYLTTYVKITGHNFPPGMGIPAALAKLKHVLDQRRQEWLLVITDLGNYIDAVFEEPERSLFNYLPTRGQVIITANNRRPMLQHCRPLFKVTNKCHVVDVPYLSDEEIHEFAEYSCPGLSGIMESTGFSFRATLDRMRVMAAIMKLMGFTVGTFAS